MIWY